MLFHPAAMKLLMHDYRGIERTERSSANWQVRMLYGADDYSVNGL
jgi:hypothetical protein